MRLVNPFLRPVGLTLLAVTAIIVLFVVQRQVFWPMITAIAGAGILAYLISDALKLAFDRGRPPAYLSDVLFHGYPVDPRGTGYPSTHAAVSTAVVVGAWPWLNRPWRIGGAVAATAICLNRMYVGAHFPLDVLGGVAIGLLTGGTVLVIAQRLSRRTSSAPA